MYIQCVAQPVNLLALAVRLQEVEELLVRELLLALGPHRPRGGTQLDINALTRTTGVAPGHLHFLYRCPEILASHLIRRNIRLVSIRMHPRMLHPA